MTTSKQARAGSTAAEDASALAWGAWTELGVAGWERTHEAWAVDLEPLILLAGALGDVDPRLRDEVTDWCIHHGRHVSRARIKNLQARLPDGPRDDFGVLAATVAEHGGPKWSGATTPRRHSPKQRVELPPLSRPSLGWVRLRAIFGLGARTEVLRVFLAHPSSELGIGQLAERAGYTRRNVNVECDSLHRAGILARHSVSNRHLYRLARPSELQALVGDVAPLRPDWSALVRIVIALVELEKVVPAASRTVPIHVKKSFARIESDLKVLQISNPVEGLTGDELRPATQEFMQATLERWAEGQWPNNASALRHA